MPSAFKSKSKERSAARAPKEQSKVAAKPMGNGTVASTYNNFSGKFHLLGPSSSVLVTQGNDKLRNTDDIDEHSRSSHGTGDFDCASNNGSCSGELEDPQEKSTSIAPRLDSIPGCDIDKREKIRQKNEKKHQRQKERCAQELHERCKGYLMSRKLEALAQKLFAMGFAADQAMMALIQNEGCLEESVAWLCNFDGSEETKQQIAADQQPGVNLKIDITDELAKIAILEVKFKRTKQEVERAVVSFEGDLENAEEFLKTQKQESTTASKPEGSGDSSGLANNKQQVMVAQNPTRPQTNGFSSGGAQQVRRDEKNLNYKILLNGSGPKEAAIKGFQPLTSPIKPKVVRQQFVQPEKRRLNANSLPSASYVTSSPLPVAASQMKSEMRLVAGGNEVKGAMHNGNLRESVIVMQRPQSAAAKQSLPSTSHSMFASEPSREWYLNGASGVDMMLNGGLGHGLRNMSLGSVNPAKQFMHANHQQSFVSNPSELAANGWGGTWGSGCIPSSLGMASSPGLFRGWSSSEYSSSLSRPDWRSTEPSPWDYTSIDWSPDTTLFNRTGNSEWLSKTWSTMFMSGRSTRPSGNLGDAGIAGLHDNNFPMDPSQSR
ncbi:hypothetical protein GUJ93_ZPchr0005g15667 [Zizania palustris]|uniref:UBA domain-containing protein n=1 Tax=Zizania palustris TaxID=103762 RepID=A0A8J5T512_ZIZPA|nr:hypothetical protein GUJ93_ZPchr0005g15667 [Zizania palustris]